MEQSQAQHNCPEPGVHEGVAFADYCAWRALNASRLKLAAKSMKHYHEFVQPDTDNLVLGRADHTATLEPDRFPLEFTVWNEGVRRGKKWEAFAEANSDKSILTQAQYADILKMRDAVRGDAVAGPIVSGPGTAEVSIVWVDEPTGILCKGRLDWIVDGVIYDLKTARDVSPRRFGNSAVEYGYDISAAFYIDAWLAATGEVATIELICVEKSAPWDVVVVPLGDDAIEAGRGKYRKLLNEVARCRQRGEWPGIAGGCKVPLRYPEWARPQNDPAELVIEGQRVIV